MTIIEEIIKSYNPKTNDEAKYVLRELLQQIVLIGLSRSDFFKYASFYGGTALRIFYGLNRYSEDLDFSLNSNSKDELFSFTPFIEKIKEVALSYDLNLENSQKDKKIKTNIESAFAKINTYQTFLSINLNKTILGLIHKDEVIKVKFKIDCNPALGFNTESKWLDIPEFAPVTVLDLPSLFAGKIHAVLCRKYKNNVKGRDYYDFLFYIQRNVKPNLEYLKNKLIDSGKITPNTNFNIYYLKEMLKERIENVNFIDVKNDSSKFLLKKEDLSFYSKDLFFQMIDKL